MIISNTSCDTFSVIAVKTTPTEMSKVAAKTGLSPECHLASFKIIEGKAAGFCRPFFFLSSFSCNQSVKSHRSKAREEEEEEEVELPDTLPVSSVSGLLKFDAVDFDKLEAVAETLKPWISNHDQQHATHTALTLVFAARSELKCSSLVLAADQRASEEPTRG
jgi:hypothetical protein